MQQTSYYQSVLRFNKQIKSAWDIPGYISSQEVEQRIYTEIDRWASLGNDGVDVVFVHRIANILMSSIIIYSFDCFTHVLAVGLRKPIFEDLPEYDFELGLNHI